jgi:V8-like Glu-specific endopeptidase
MRSLYIAIFSIILLSTYTSRASDKYIEDEKEQRDSVFVDEQKSTSSKNYRGSKFFTVMLFLFFNIFPVLGSDSIDVILSNFSDTNKDSSALSLAYQQQDIHYNFAKMYANSYVPSSAEMGIETSESLQRRLNVFGIDQRVISQDLYPETTVGLLIINGGEFDKACTATLVSPLHVLTNAHCVFDEKKDPSGDFVNRHLPEGWSKSSFYPNRRTKHDYHKRVTWKSIHYPSRYLTSEDGFYEDDWTIIELNEAIGLVYGWMGVENIKNKDYIFPKFAEQINLIGYSHDGYSRDPGAHYNCSLFGAFLVNNHIQVLHDCDSTKGSSGSGIYRKFDIDGQKAAHIVALHHAEFVLEEGGFYSERFSLNKANLALITTPIVSSLISLLETIYSNTTSNRSGIFNSTDGGDDGGDFEIGIFIYIGGAIVVTCLSCTMISCYKKKQAKIPSSDDSSKTDLDEIEKGAVI